MELIAKQPHVNVKASICDSLGYLNILTKQYSDAERFLKESAQIFQKIPDKAQLVGTFLHLSELHERKNNRKLARSYAERALKLEQNASALMLLWIVLKVASLRNDRATSSAWPRAIKAPLQLDR